MSEESEILSTEHRQQTSTLKKYAWLPGVVYSLLTIAGLLVGWGIFYGRDMARMEAKIDLLNRDYANIRADLTSNDALDSLREVAHDVEHRKYSGLFILIGRRFNFNDRYYDLLQQ